MNADAERLKYHSMIPEYASQIVSILTQLMGTFKALEAEWQDPVERSFKRNHIDEIDKTVDSSLRGGNIHDIMGIKDLLVRLDQIMQKMSSLSEMHFNVIRTDQSGRNKDVSSCFTQSEDIIPYPRSETQDRWRRKMSREEIDDINETRAKTSY